MSMFIIIVNIFSIYREIICRQNYFDSEDYKSYYFVLKIFSFIKIFNHLNYIYQ